MSMIVLFCACTASRQPETPITGVELDVDRDEVAAGDSVTIELDNDSPGPVGFNLCSSEMERRDAGEWRQVPSDRVCTRELRILAAGEEAHYRLQIPPGLAPGEYRFHTPVELQDTRVSGSVRSEAFRVRT